MGLRTLRLTTFTATTTLGTVEDSECGAALGRSGKRTVMKVQNSAFESVPNFVCSQFDWKTVCLCTVEKALSALTWSLPIKSV